MFLRALWNRGTGMKSTWNMQNPRQVQAQGETVDLGAETGTLY